VTDNAASSVSPVSMLMGSLIIAVGSFSATSSMFIPPCACMHGCVRACMLRACVWARKVTLLHTKQSKTESRVYNFGVPTCVDATNMGPAVARSITMARYNSLAILTFSTSMT
jgi:hypothetical protein